MSSGRIRRKPADIATGLSGLVLLFILLIFTAYTIFTPSYTSGSLETQTTKTREGDLDITTVTYISQTGKPEVPRDKGYATVIRTARDGKTILEAYLDEKGNPAVLTEGYSSIRREYTNGLNTEIIYQDAGKHPTVISSGYDSIRRTYNEDRLADTDTYWIGEEQVEHKQGYWSLKRIYGQGNDRKRVVRQEYRDQNGQLTLNSSGYAYLEQVFNDRGKVAAQRYYGPEGQPVSIGFGYYGFRREYDDEGRTIRTVYLGEDGEPADTSRGYAIARTVYDTAGTKTLYFDADGKPATAGKNQFGVLKTENGSTYLNENGEVLIRLDNILLTYPVLVLAIGILVMIVAFLAKGKFRILFIAVYACFIIYMTMAWRETGTGRFQLELFRSYRQFMTNKIMRQDILNNIWLFVPFGAAVCNLLRSRISTGRALMLSVLICICLSMAIEATQYFAGIGMCEADDVVSNGLGGLIGAAAAGIINQQERRRRK